LTIAAVEFATHRETFIVTVALLFVFDFSNNL
jgi:hypothetical protein